MADAKKILLQTVWLIKPQGLEPYLEGEALHPIFTFQTKIQNKRNGIPFIELQHDE